MKAEKKTFRLGEKTILELHFRRFGGTFLIPYLISSSQKPSQVSNVASISQKGNKDSLFERSSVLPRVTQLVYSRAHSVFQSLRSSSSFFFY